MLTLSYKMPWQIPTMSLNSNYNCCIVARELVEGKVPWTKMDLLAWGPTFQRWQRDDCVGNRTNEEFVCLLPSSICRQEGTKSTNNKLQNGVMWLPSRGRQAGHYYHLWTEGTAESSEAVQLISNLSWSWTSELEFQHKTDTVKERVWMDDLMIKHVNYD